MDFKWKLREIVVTAMLCAVIGVVFMLWDGLYVSLGPVLGPIGIEVIYGIYFVSALLIMYIMRKPGAAILGSVMTGLINILLGSPYGFANVMIACLFQGVAAELLFFITRYKKVNLTTLSISSIITAIILFGRDYVTFGYGANPTSVLIGMLGIRIISCIILGAVLSKIVGDALAKTGVLNNFNICKK